MGSGVIVGADGLIITNNHVVEGADQILVALADRREFKAKILFADPRLDLALLKVETEGAVLPVIRMADSDRVEVGDVTVQAKPKSAIFTGASSAGDSIRKFSGFRSL